MAGVREHVWPMITSGLVRPVVHARVPMPEAARIVVFDSGVPGNVQKVASGETLGTIVGG